MHPGDQFICQVICNEFRLTLSLVHIDQIYPFLESTTLLSFASSQLIQLVAFAPCTSASARITSSMSTNSSRAS